MNKLLQVLNASTFGHKDAPLFPLLEGLEFQRAHYASRKKEI